MLKRVENIEDRADRLLQQVAKSTERRDALLAEVSSMVERAVHPQTGTIEPLLREIADVRDRALPAYVDQSAQHANTMNECAALAQRSTARHAQLSTLLERVQLAKRVAESMKAMEVNVAAASEAMSAKDLEKAVALVKSYEQARQVVTTSSSSGGLNEGKASPAASTATAPAPAAVVDPAIAEVRGKARLALEKALDEAIQSHDKLGIMQAAKLLAQLGYAEEAGTRYCTWVCDHTVQALKKMVERELAKMEDTTQAAKTYLVLVSQLLDTVAAAFESEEAFVHEHFGNRGALRLIHDLHHRSTAQCVPVLAKFRTARQETLERLLAKDAKVQAFLDARQAAYANPAKMATKALPNGNVVLVSSDEEDDDDGDELEESDAAQDDADDREESGQIAVVGEGGSGPSSGAGSPAPQGMVAVMDEVALSRSVADARQADQILEEMSHLVSCCDVYMAFAAEKQATYRARLAKETAAKAASVAAGNSTDPIARDGDDELLEQNRDSALLSAVQDMLSLYVPVQVSYFQTAFHHALQLQWTGVHKALAEPAASQKGSTPATSRNQGTPAAQGNGATSTSLMAGLSSLYAAAAGGVADLGTLNLIGGGVGGSGGGSAQSQAQALEALRQQQRTYQFYSNNSSVTLADDVFYFLRVAVHRAMNTRSTQITSAIAMSAIDLIQTRLLPELRRHAGPRALARHKHRRGRAGGTTTGLFPGVVGSGGGTGATASPFLPPPPLLRWTAVTAQSTEYAHKLAEELRRLAATVHKGRDLIRFQELADDMTHVSRDVRNTEWKLWIAKDARACYDGLMPPHLRRLAALSYATGLTEEVFYHYELNDPWVQACLADWAALLDYTRPLFDSASSDQLVHAIAAHLVAKLRAVWMQKTFNTLGALQLDKDVRAIRDFFFGRVQEISLRAVFAPLALMSTLLLCDSPRDALEEVQNTALTADEKKAVLLLRQDFSKEEVMALRL